MSHETEVRALPITVGSRSIDHRWHLDGRIWQRRGIELYARAEAEAVARVDLRDGLHAAIAPYATGEDLYAAMVSYG